MLAPFPLRLKTLTTPHVAISAKEIHEILPRDTKLIGVTLSLAAQNENTRPTEKQTKNPPKNKEDDKVGFVKIVVFDEQNRVLAIKDKSRFVLPGGRIEWDDDDAETAARREVFETANIALGLVIPVIVIKTKDHKKQTTKTIVFAARMTGSEQTIFNQKRKYRFLSMEGFLEVTGHRNELVRTLINAAFKVLVSEEIKGDHDETTQKGREKYNSKSLF